MENLTIHNQIASNKTKTWFIMTAFSIFVIGVGYVFAQALGYGSGILGYFIIFSVLTNLVSYYFSDTFVLAISRAKPITKSGNKELYNIVENLCIGAGLPMPKIYVIDDSAPNAFATGRDPKHASIALTTGLLNKLEKIELEGVVGHELSHIRNYDTRIMVVVSVLVGFIALLADWFFRASWFRSSDRDDRKSGGVFVIVALILAILAPLIAQVIKAAISRRREFLADASSALLTRYPDGLADALMKISSDKEVLEVANRGTAHLYIVNPLKNYGEFMTKLFSTHPPIEERVKALRAM